MADNYGGDRASYLYGPQAQYDRLNRPCPSKKVNLFPAAIGEEEDSDASADETASDSSAFAPIALARSDSGSSATSAAAAAAAVADKTDASEDIDSNAAAVVLRLRPAGQQSASSDFSVERNVFKQRLPVGTDCNQGKVPEKHFTFTHIFPESTTQASVYETCVRDAIENDENLTVLTYGTSGSGKTHTLLGIHSDSPGIIPRAIEHIFMRHGGNVCSTPAVKVAHGSVVLVPDAQFRAEAALRRSLIGPDGGGAPEMASAYALHQMRIQHDHEFAAYGGQPTDAAEQRSVFVWVSFAEIYNENVFDLLPTPLPRARAGGQNKEQQRKDKVKHKSHFNKENCPQAGQQQQPQQQQQQQQRKTLKVISNDGNAFIKELNAVHCRTAEDAYKLLNAGLNNITYAATNINRHSSRSHCIYFLDVIVNGANPVEFEHVSYKFCDLAGSERLKKTDNVGNRLKEAQSINNSLMVLGRCLDAVYHKQSIVPIRDSKLTVLLQASLLGREKIKMIVNMMPSLEFLEENLNVLNFASMAKQIVYKPPTQAEMKKRGTARFSWFMAHATSSSSPARGAAAAAGDGDAEPAPEASFTEMGDVTQVSFLLDENDRLKLEVEDLFVQLDEYRQIIRELRDEVDCRQNVIDKMIVDNQHRAKKRDEHWQKRIEHEKDVLLDEMRFQIGKIEAKYQRILAQRENAPHKEMVLDLTGTDDGDDDDEIAVACPPSPRLAVDDLATEYPQHLASAEADSTSAVSSTATSEQDDGEHKVEERRSIDGCERTSNIVLPFGPLQSRKSHHL